MAINLKKVAQKATVLAEIMEGKEKGNTEELIGKIVTINDCEVMYLSNENGQQEEVWAFTVQELPRKFFFAGTVMRNVFKAILSECQGDYAELYSAVSSQGLTVKFANGRTKSGRPVTTVEVI